SLEPVPCCCSIPLISSFLSVFDDQASAQHSHAAGKLVTPGLVGRELNVGGLERREEALDPEIREDDLLGAARGLLTIEMETDRRSCANADLRGRVAARDLYRHLLNAARRSGRRARAPLGEEEVP